MISFLQKQIVKILILLINTIRPLLGPSSCCIYPVTCTQYAKKNLQEKPLYISIPLIIWRILKCNPITAIYWKIKKFIKFK